MFKRSTSTALKENAAAAADLAEQLASDRTLRRRLLAAAGHGVRANERVRRQFGVAALANRLAADRQLRQELLQMARQLQAARKQAERKRTHRLRTALLVLVGAGVATAAALPRPRRWLAALLGGVKPGRVEARAVTESIEIDVPVSAAYDQWTLFEEFPQFMDGVDEVRQLDETRLRWVVSVAGKRAEWDAKILEQHPHQEITWISEDGKKTRGTVTFEPLGPARTLVRLSMSYEAEGFGEAIGSAVGLDSRRVRGDLGRFKDLIESRGRANGGRRDHISAGAPETTQDGSEV